MSALSRDRKKKQHSITDEIFEDDGTSADETDNDADDLEEDESLLDDDVELLDAEGKDISHFNRDLWKMNVLPDKSDL
jgi:hypothetical protein